jgi:Fic family protein
MKVGPYTVDDEVRIRLVMIARSLAQLDAAGVFATPAAQALRKELQDQFVLHSAGIQGNRMTLADVRAVVYDHAVLEGPSRHEQMEVLNLANGVEYVNLLAEDDLPLTERLIRIMHALVMRGLLPSDTEPGVYRAQDLPDLAYGPPAAYAVTAEMGTFARWMATRPDAPEYEADPLVRATVAHTWLLTVHPFLNGNGRTARLVQNLMLLRAGYPWCIVRTDDRVRYMQALEEAGLRHDATSMVALMVERMHDSVALYEQLL